MRALDIFSSNSNHQNRAQILHSFKILAVLATQKIIKCNFRCRSSGTYILVQLSD